MGWPGCGGLCLGPTPRSSPPSTKIRTTSALAGWRRRGRLRPWPIRTTPPPPAPATGARFLGPPARDRIAAIARDNGAGRPSLGHQFRPRWIAGRDGTFAHDRSGQPSWWQGLFVRMTLPPRRRIAASGCRRATRGRSGSLRRAPAARVGRGGGCFHGLRDLPSRWLEAATRTPVQQGDSRPMTRAGAPALATLTASAPRLGHLLREMDSFGPLAAMVAAASTGPAEDALPRRPMTFIARSDMGHHLTPGDADADFIPPGLFPPPP